VNKVGTSVAITITALIAGCTSMSSTMLNRQDDDVFVGNSNGQPRQDGRPRPFKGVPMTVRVPTHLDIAIKENILLYRTKDGRLQRVKTAKRSLFVETTPIETDKVFMVDVKRPLAGTVDYTLTFGGVDANGTDNSQYFTEVKNKIQDKTIQDVNTALQSILPLLRGLPTGKSTGADLTSALDAQIIPEVRVVAWKRFDLDAPDFAQQVAAFIELHLNCCNDCREYRGVSEPPPSPNQQTGPTPAATTVVPMLPAAAPAPENGF
jgi:hypothetical protein